MRKTKLLVAMLLATPIVIHAAVTKKMKSEDLSNLIIEGENRLRIKSVMPAVEWQPQVYRDLTDEFKGGQLVSSLVTPPVATPPMDFDPTLNTGKSATPWLDRVSEPPLITLNVKPEDKTRKVEWLFLVKDSKGQAIYEMRKKGLMPEQVQWDGFDRGNHPIQVGYDYTYSLSIIDEAGNPKRFSGDSFRLPAFRYTKGSKTSQLFDPDALFEPSSAKFSKSGASYLIEVKDTLRPTYGKSVAILTYDDDQKFALTRSNAIRQYLMSALDYPPEKMTASGATKKEGQGYRHVEITLH